MRGMSNINRVPAGVPAGGQFAEGRKPESDLPHLDASYVDRTADILKKHQFVPARQVIAAPGNASHWWNNHKVSAEYDVRGGFERMNRAPKSVGSMRKTYRGTDFSITMPSVTSVRRMADTLKTGQAFDVPISTPGPNGSQVHSWVRVARSKNGRWKARALGKMDEHTRAGLSESVNSMLEARRIEDNFAGRKRTELIEKARQRRLDSLREGTTPVRSSWIDSLRYDEGNKAMVMTTESGKSYAYDVSKDVFDNVSTAYSPGRIINREIKGQVAEARVEQCGQCNRFTADLGGHRCPAGRRAGGTPPASVRRDAAMVTSGQNRLFKLFKRKNS